MCEGDKVSSPLPRPSTLHPKCGEPMLLPRGTPGVRPRSPPSPQLASKGHMTGAGSPQPVGAASLHSDVFSSQPRCPARENGCQSSLPKSDPSGDFWKSALDTSPSNVSWKSTIPGHLPPPTFCSHDLWSHGWSPVSIIIHSVLLYSTVGVSFKTIPAENFSVLCDPLIVRICRWRSRTPRPEGPEELFVICPQENSQSHL